MSKKINFTARSMVLAGNPIKVTYSMDGNNVIVKGKGENADLIMVIKPSDENYVSARLAYETKKQHQEMAKAKNPDYDPTYYHGEILKGDGYLIHMDGDLEKVTITFKRKPSEYIRNLIKAAGFYWSPVHKQWLRNLNDAAYIAAKAIHSNLTYNEGCLAIWQS